MEIRFIDISLKRNVDLKGMHVPTDWLIKAANGIVDFRKIAIEQLRDRGFDERGTPLLNSELFSEGELEAELVLIERNTVCSRDDVIEILNSCGYPNWFLRQHLKKVLEAIVQIKSKGYDNEYVKLWIRDNPKEYIGEL